MYVFSLLCVKTYVYIQQRNTLTHIHTHLYTRTRYKQGSMKSIQQGTDETRSILSIPKI